MSTSLTLPVASDFYATLDQLTDTSGDFVNSGATVTVNVWRKNRALLAGPITASYVTGSQGKYRALIPKATAFTEGQRYDFEFTVIVGTSETHLWLSDAVAERYEP